MRLLRGTLMPAEIIRRKLDYFCHSPSLKNACAFFGEAGLMVPELPEGIGPVTVLNSLPGVVAHLAAELRVGGQAADCFCKIIHI